MLLLWQVQSLSIPLPDDEVYSSRCSCKHSGWQCSAIVPRTELSKTWRNGHIQPNNTNPFFPSEAQALSHGHSSVAMAQGESLEIFHDRSARFLINSAPIKSKNAVSQTSCLPPAAGTRPAQVPRWFHVSLQIHWPNSALQSTQDASESHPGPTGVRGERGAIRDNESGPTPL